MKISGKKLSAEERKLIHMMRKAFGDLTRALETFERDIKRIRKAKGRKKTQHRLVDSKLPRN